MPPSPSGARDHRAVAPQDDLSAAVTEASDGELRIAVRAQPGSRRPGVAGLRGAALLVRVAAPPERGRANAEVERLVADALGVRPGAVRVRAGTTSRSKVLAVRGVVRDDALARLAGLVEEGG